MKGFLQFLLGVVIVGTVFYSQHKPKIDTWITDGQIEVVDRQVEEKTRKDNVLGEEEAIEAIFNQYPKGSVVKGYRLGNPTGYGGVSRHESFNTRNKREFTVGYNLDNGRIGYLEGVVTKTNGVIRVKVDKVILE